MHSAYRPCGHRRAAPPGAPKLDKPASTTVLWPSQASGTPAATSTAFCAARCLRPIHLADGPAVAGRVGDASHKDSLALEVDVEGQHRRRRDAPDGLRYAGLQRRRAERVGAHRRGAEQERHGHLRWDGVSDVPDGRGSLCTRLHTPADRPTPIGRKRKLIDTIFARSDTAGALDP